MPELGRKRPTSSLRLNLDPRAHLQPSETSNVPNSGQEFEGETSTKRAKTLLLLNSNNGRAVSSNNSNGGCLSPTDSPKLLEESLRQAAEIQKNKQKQEEEGKIGRFCLLSPLDNAGFTYHALDTRSQKLKTCQVLSKDEYQHLIDVSQRLNSNKGTSNWPYLERKEMAEKILPIDVELIRHTDGKYYLFAEKNYGSLHSFVQSKKKLDENESRQFFGQIIRIVAFCHSLGIVVRDLKLRKFVFADEKQQVLRLGSISDLVVCADIFDDQLSDRHGCPAYVSPEILDLQQKSYSGKLADIWSLGVMLFVMLIGRYPFYAATPAGLFGKIRQGIFVIPSDVKLSQEMKLLLRGLLRREAKERPTAMTLLKLPWLQKQKESLVEENRKISTASGAQKPKKLGKFVDNDDQVVPTVVVGPPKKDSESSGGE